MRNRSIFISGALAGILSFTAGSARGQDNSEPFPITVTAVPQLVVIWVKGGNRGAPVVVVTGETLPHNGNSVRFRVEGAPIPITGVVAIDEAGRFKGRTFAPLEGGEYTITVTAPDGKGEASVTVNAVEIEDVEDVEEKAVAAVRQAATAAATGLSGLIGAIRAENTLAGRAAGPVQTIADRVVVLQRETARVRGLTSGMSAADAGCHQLAFVSELFKAVSALLNVQRSLLAVAVGLSKDLVSDVAANAAKAKGAGPTLGFATTRS